MSAPSYYWMVILAAMVNHTISVEVGWHTMEGVAAQGSGQDRVGLHEEQKYVDEDRAQRKEGREGGSSGAKVL